MSDTGLARARVVISLLRQRLGDDGWTAYGMGSLGYGNYVPGWSDLDLDVIFVDGRQEAGNDSGTSLTELANRHGFADVDVKSFMISDLVGPCMALEYGLANRKVMLIDSAVHLFGPDIREQLTRPGSEELRAESERVAAGLANMGDVWWDSRPIDDLAALLALPARLLYTARTGQVTDKQTALEAFLVGPDRPPPSCWPWFCWSLACRIWTPARSVPEQAIQLARVAAREALVWTAERLGQLSC